MSYNDLEVSIQAGEPKELYHFRQGAQCWLYTSADEDTPFGGELYAARTISRSSFTRNDEAAASEVQIRLDRGLNVTPQFLNQSTPTPVYVRIYRMHRTDVEAITIFRGRVANAEIELDELVLTVQSPLGKDEVELPRELMLRTCAHVLYGAECRVDPTAFQLATTISSVGAGTQGNVYQVASIGGHPTGWFSGGVLVKDTTGQRAFIELQFGTTLTLTKPMYGLAVSDDVTLFAGCDRTVETCLSKFNNVPNFGGYPRLPERNPFVQIPSENIIE